MADLDSGATARFDFIGDERFRQSLTDDSREIDRCFEVGAWKAVHVLAGSIVEALLVEYLVVSDYQTRCKKDPLSLDLSQAINACRTAGVLSQRAADLSSVIRGFRNLIHPGRSVRLDENVDTNTASVAKALVEIVIDEISKAKDSEVRLYSTTNLPTN